VNFLLVSEICNLAVNYKGCNLPSTQYTTVRDRLFPAAGTHLCNTGLLWCWALVVAQLSLCITD